MPAMVFISKQKLFIAGMVAQSPGLRALTSLAATRTSVPPMRRDRVVEGVLKALPSLPPTSIGAGEDLAAVLAVAKSRHPHRRSSALWDPVLAGFQGEERSLAEDCVALIRELFYRQRQAA